MRILIFDSDGKLKHELERVRSRGINPYGDFVARFDPDAPRKLFVAYRGTWDHLEEFDDRTEGANIVPGMAGLADRPTERVTLATQPTPPVVPGSYAMPDPNLSLNNPYAGQLAEAMAIHCTCAMLRCPVVINPASAEDRKWWQRRQQPQLSTSMSGKLPPSATAPFRQCIHENGHAAREDVDAHTWHEGGWPYGPHNHHPRCPRHPETYNRPNAEEGHPVPGGITSADELAAQPPTDPPAYAAAEIGPAWVTEPTTDRTLVRPFVTGQHRAN